MRELIERHGFEFVPGDEPPEAAIAPIRDRLAVAPPAEASILGNRELFARLAATAMLPHVDAACARWTPDLVLRDPCEYSAAVVAGDRSIPSAQIGISLAEVEWGSLVAASPALEEHRTELTAEIAAAPYLTRFPAVIDPSPFASTVRYRPLQATGEPLPNWWTNRSAPLVYLTLGTVFPHMTFAADVYRLLLQALEALDVRVLLTVGHAFDLDRLGAVPERAHVERWVDHDRVFAAADVVVCHGGSGTVLGAIDAGVPMVVLPFFSDQHTNAQLVERHRLGLVVERSPSANTRPLFGDDDAERLTAAVRSVLDDNGRYAGLRAGDELVEVASAATVLRQLLA